MIIYSVTVSIENSVEADWLQWMKDVHIPDVMSTGLFIDSHLHRLIDPPSQDPSATTYNIQYSVATMTDFVAYQERFAPALQKDHTERYKDKFVAFRTLLERL